LPKSDQFCLRCCCILRYCKRTHPEGKRGRSLWRSHHRSAVYNSKK